MSNGDHIAMVPFNADELAYQATPCRLRCPPPVKSDEEEYKELKELVEKQEDRVQKIQTSAFQLGSYYFVFQGVVFSAIANATTLTHSDAWFIIVPSIVAAILNFVALYRISWTYINAKDSLDETWSRWDKVGKIIYDSSGVLSPDDDEAAANDTQLITETDKCTPTIRNAAMFGCLLLFLVFTVVILLGAWFITRNHEIRRSKVYKRNDTDNCLGICDGFNSCMNFCQTGIN